MKRVLVTGSNGQVGTELLRLAPGLEIMAIGRNRKELDICDSSAVRNEIENLTPDAVVNTAAYTAVDKAEHDKKDVFAINEEGAANLAHACAISGVPLIHISTDYVFDGNSKIPYREGDPMSPLGIYGDSKLAGERAVLRACAKTLVLRTAWVYSAYGSNFVKSMLHFGGEREELRIVNDQYGGPTAACDIAKTIWQIIKRLDDTVQPWGIYHYCGAPSTTWHAFAEEIFAEARRQDYKLRVSSVVAIPTKEYPTPTTRPKNSVLNCEKIGTVFNIHQPDWRASLKKIIKTLKA